jgi:glycosyltransferase involved in cell wall biosynthesis
LSKVICFSYERMFHPFGILSGPGSRLWEIAQSLKRKGHKVTIAQLNHTSNFTKEGINFISWDTQRLSKIESEFDVAFLPLSAYMNQYFDKIKKIPTVIDLSTPIIIESMTHSIGNKQDFFLNDGILPTYQAITNGDFFIVSNRAQKHFYLGMISLLGINNFNSDLIKIAPLAPRKIKQKIKTTKILSSLVGKNKKIMVFMGGLYSWYDYKTPILAMKQICKKHNDAVLVFVGSLNPNIPELTKKNYENAKKLTKKVKLLDKNIFFHDWVSSVDRFSIYKEAKLAIVSSYDTSESAMSYRMRIIDFWHGDLPVISSKNDELSGIIDDYNLGETVSVEDPEILSKKIIKILDDESVLKEYQRNIKKYVKTEFNIDKTIEPLHKFLLKPKIVSKKSKLDFLKIIIEQKNRIKNLEYIKDDKEGVNKSLVNEIKRLQDILEEYRLQLKDFELKHKVDDDIINEYSQKIQYLNNEIDSTKKELIELIKLRRIFEDTISKQKEYIGNFKSSVVYPFYRITSNIGRTKLGKFIQKLLK